ncbi:pyroglutamyl-peptidase I [Pseudoxanthomonas kalamensis DSM 18571]|uniref:pyroglutamyl-peptidase I n=1 Tax=Pseudoxanthomonas kalamensis TaxID=289483 RepID=UPI0013918394|nr:pyroglutamyl-peptidase I [Pseudoxanthomonas kalamensis]KAF1709971.1 pyroglutamyl-peptidase I [Pseudoxanthomonas kalamensis DSM 18571]
MTARRPPIVLLTGFAPFGGEPVNPSWQAVAALHGRRVGGHRIVARELPVEFGASLKALRKALRETRPALVICVGQAGGRARISLERIAINIDDARIPDNAGRQPVDLPVIADGPAAYFSSLPIKAMHHALCTAGFPAEISQTAGTYVCNHVFYGLMHALRRQRRVRGGFIHIPYSPAQAAAHPGAPSLSVDTVAAALKLVVKTALATSQDIRQPGGAEH